MAADSSAYDAVLKEVWTSDSLEEQLYQGNPLLDSIEKLDSFSIGDKAVTPVHTGRSGGYSVVPRAGSTSLNAADAQESQQATWNYTHHWFRIAIETAAIDETSDKSKAVASVVDTEVNRGLDDLRKQLTRQAFSNGDALIAKCGTTSAATEVELDTSDYGYDAIARGWLYPGLPVDVGTAADEDADVAGSVITAVEEDSASPSITIGTAITTTTSDFVSIADARSGTTSYEMNGLRNLISDTTTVGGIAPASVPGWKAASVDTTTTTLTLPAIYAQERAVFQKTGNSPDWALTSPKQFEALYKLLQSQVRFSGDGSLSAGNMEGLKVGGITVQRQPDCPDRAFYCLTKKDLFAVRTEKPAWAPQKYGKSSILQYVEGTTRMESAAVYRLQLGLKRRNSHSVLASLTD